MKCTFAMTKGNFLGFTVHEHGIEIDREKAQAIICAQPPTNKKELQRLIGKVNFLRRFISNLSGKIKPFSPLLKANKEGTFEWTKDHQAAFDRIKDDFTRPPVMTAPTAGRPLRLYVSATEETIFLAQEDDRGREQAIYYFSRILTEVESRYLPMEKFCLALYAAAVKLRHYMVVTTVQVISKVNLVRYLLHRPHLNGRLGKWALTLMEYQFKHVPQSAIRGQVLADFLADHPSLEIDLTEVAQQEVVLTRRWVLQFDGSVTHKRSGAGLIIRSPTGKEFHFMICMAFQCTNNQAEYEALVQGLLLLKERNIDNISVWGRFDASHTAGEGRVSMSRPNFAAILHFGSGSCSQLQTNRVSSYISNRKPAGQRPGSNGVRI